MASNIPPTNSLGLAFNVPEVDHPAEPQLPPEDVEPQPAPKSPIAEQQQREKKKPYVNPDRVKTGGPQREKLTDEELAERMARMREQNEKIKQRRLDVAADEAAFKKTQEAERQKMERTKKIQANVDKSREQNVKRKMDKAQNREWDSGKPATAAWKNTPKNDQEPTPSTTAGECALAINSSSSPQSPISTEQSETSNWVRGSGPPRGSGRGRGRGRGRGGRGVIPRANLHNGTAPTMAEAQEFRGSNGEKKESRDAAPPAPS